MTENLQPDQRDAADNLVITARTKRQDLGRLFDQFYPPILAYCLRYKPKEAQVYRVIYADFTVREREEAPVVEDAVKLVS